MFWLADEIAPPRTCVLKWTRQVGTAAVAAMERVPEVVWRQRDRAHYLTYDESVNEAGGHVRTTLRLESDALTWIRHGLVTWRHTFRVGEKHHSEMQIGGQRVGMDTETHFLAIEIEPSGGRVEVVYDMQMDGESQRVRLKFNFHEGEIDGAEQG
ncbi:DUF1934 domain-containing protein [Alicyclobacillus fodiniaquatilis]|jgi:uncharacterized beta-barrel protein YwiB (DUF1934 family)|uniref:DUF1934 domain-containing protein n=1 Tax=Alicyclobacillus fodiniaquatilis TaxID=1661150 RepID=A0ABW4JHF0_9BACL